MQIRDLLNKGEHTLVGSGVPNARRNAEWLLCRALNCTPLDLYVSSTQPAADDRVDHYENMIRRRAAREPLQHILGTTEFMSLPFDVRPGVFVPRPDTEILVEHTEARLRGLPLDRPLAAVDLCCGSGVIAVSLARRVPNLEVVAVDMSPEAVALTAHNAALNDVADRVSVLQDDAVEHLSRSAPGGLAAVLCNPPYIETGLIRSLPPEVRDHEPVAALDGGSDGLNFYRRLVPALRDALRPGGFVALEIGDTQGGAVSTMLAGTGLDGIEVIPDYAGRDRVVMAKQLPESSHHG